MVKITEPVGVPGSPCDPTVAVNVTDCPNTLGFNDEVTVVVVDCCVAPASTQGVAPFSLVRGNPGPRWSVAVPDGTSGTEPAQIAAPPTTGN
jgi:hypothetical protein